MPFLSLVEAQQNLIALRDRYFEAMADIIVAWHEPAGSVRGTHGLRGIMSFAGS